jgi:pimeloyl-ACP methyl ester carboxylesterase
MSLSRDSAGAPGRGHSVHRFAGRERLELGLGDLQLRALRWLLVRATRLRPGELAIPGRVFDADGPITIPYLRRGARSRDLPLVLVHGFGGDKETWLMLAGALPRTTPLIMLDLPGFGHASPIPDATMSPLRLARAMALFLDGLGVERFDLAGTSMGGGVSLGLSRLAPERVRSLTLINSIGADRDDILGPSRYREALDRGHNPLIPRNLADAERMLALVMTRPPMLPRSMLRRAATDRVAMSDRLQAMFDSWMAASDEDALPGALSDLSMPALILCGQRDHVIHPSISRSMAAALPRAILHELPDVGHLPQLEAPLRTARILGRFLATIDE